MTQDTTQSCQEQLEQLQKEFDDFAYIVSHDLKAPLRAIHNLSGWISEDLGENLDADVKQNIHLLQNRAERMERMIAALLQYSRVGRYDLETREVDVEKLVQQLAAPLVQETGLLIHTQQLPVLTTYSKKLEAVFAQLLENAVKFNDNQLPQVWISGSQQAGFYLFKVKDNGIGIAPDLLEKVFKMFFTTQPKDRQETVGAGLPLAKKIVQYVGGTIGATSDLGQGTEIYFTWPHTA